MTFQIEGVTEPSASAGLITAKGHRIVLDDEDVHIEHKPMGRRAKLRKNGHVLIMCAKVMPDTPAARCRQDGYKFCMGRASRDRTASDDERDLNK